MTTITQLEKSLERTRKQVLKGKCLKGDFGIIECQKSIKEEIEYSGKSLHQLYVEYITRALKDGMFNTTMIVACELLMKG